MIKVTIYEKEQLGKDLYKEQGKIESLIPNALQYVGSEMKNDLQRGIFSDWYTQYSPVEYERRTDNPGKGTPLGDSSNISIAVKGKELQFDYEPTGEYIGKPFWSKRSGDSLIEFLQNGMWQGVYNIVPARPFWNNFVERQFNQEIMTNFARGMLPYKVESDGVGKDIQKAEIMESLLDAGTIGTVQR